MTIVCLRYRQVIPSKRRNICTRLHCIISQMISTFTVTANLNSSLAKYLLLSPFEGLNSGMTERRSITTSTLVRCWRHNPIRLFRESLWGRACRSEFRRVSSHKTQPDRRSSHHGGSLSSLFRDHYASSARLPSIPRQVFFLWLKIFKTISSSGINRFMMCLQIWEEGSTEKRHCLFFSSTI